MDIMLLGETHVASTSQQRFYGFWMPAGGNDGVAAVEVFYADNNDGWEIYMETKSSDADDSGASNIGSVAITAATTTPATYKFDVTDAKDLVRYMVYSSRGGRLHLQFAQPLWHPN